MYLIAWQTTIFIRNRKNVGYASTCNSVGQTAGYFLGYVLFVAFESPDFCNKYLRSVPEPKGILTLSGANWNVFEERLRISNGSFYNSGFLYFWGLLFLVSTTLVWLLKKEKKPLDHSENEVEENLSIPETYKLLLKIFRLPAIQWTVVVLLTCRVTLLQFEIVLRLD